MAEIYLAIVLGALVLMVASMMVWRAGARPILNVVDYRNIENPDALHSWAARRFALAALSSAVLAWAAWSKPSYALAILFVFCILVISLAMSIIAGTHRFHRA